METSNTNVRRVLFVHGTGGPVGNGNHAWAEPGGSFAKALQSELGEEFCIDPPFSWDGANSERSRREAGDRPRKHLEDEYETKGLQYDLIGHSHGGSVIWWALRGASPRRLRGLKTVTTVGTPFLLFNVSPTWIMPLLGLLLFALVAAGIGIDFSAPRDEAGSTYELLRAVYESGSAFETALAAFAGAALTLSVLALAYFFLQGFLAAPFDLWRWWKDRAIVRWLGQRHLVVTSQQDEAIHLLRSTMPLRRITTPPSIPAEMNIAMRFVLHFWRAAASSLRELGNQFVWRFLTRIAQGQTTRHLELFDVSTSPLAHTRYPAALSSEAEAALSKMTSDEASASVQRLRSALAMTSSNHGNLAFFIRNFVDVLTWKELVHNSYFSAPNHSQKPVVLEALAVHLRNTEISVQDRLAAVQKTTDAPRRSWTPWYLAAAYQVLPVSLAIFSILVTRAISEPYSPEAAILRLFPAPIDARSLPEATSGREFEVTSQSSIDKIFIEQLHNHSLLQFGSEKLFDFNSLFSGMALVATPEIETHVLEWSRSGDTAEEREILDAAKALYLEPPLSTDDWSVLLSKFRFEDGLWISMIGALSSLKDETSRRSFIQSLVTQKKNVYSELLLQAKYCEYLGRHFALFGGFLPEACSSLVSTRTYRFAVQRYIWDRVGDSFNSLRFAQSKSQAFWRDWIAEDYQPCTITDLDRSALNGETGIRYDIKAAIQWTSRLSALRPYLTGWADPKCVEKGITPGSYKKEGVESLVSTLSAWPKVDDKEENEAHISVPELVTFATWTAAAIKLNSIRSSEDDNLKATADEGWLKSNISDIFFSSIYTMNSKLEYTARNISREYTSEKRKIYDNSICNVILEHAGRNSTRKEFIEFVQNLLWHYENFKIGSNDCFFHLNGFSQQDAWLYTIYLEELLSGRNHDYKNNSRLQRFNAQYAEFARMVRSDFGSKLNYKINNNTDYEITCPGTDRRERLRSEYLSCSDNDALIDGLNYGKALIISNAFATTGRFSDLLQLASSLRDECIRLENEQKLRLEKEQKQSRICIGTFVKRMRIRALIGLGRFSEAQLTARLLPSELRSEANVCIASTILPNRTNPDDYWRAKRFFDSGRYETGLRLWTAAAADGDLNSQLRLADMYENAIYVAQDSFESLKWFGLAQRNPAFGDLVANNSQRTSSSSDNEFRAQTKETIDNLEKKFNTKDVRQWIADNSEYPGFDELERAYSCVGNADLLMDLGTIFEGASPSEKAMTRACGYFKLAARAGSQEAKAKLNIFWEKQNPRSRSACDQFVANWSPPSKEQCRKQRLPITTAVGCSKLSDQPLPKFETLLEAVRAETERRETYRSRLTRPEPARE